MCLVCTRISDIQNNSNPYFICELDTSYVVLGDSQYYKGYTLLLSKYHKKELHELESSIKLKFLEEMSIVAESVFNVFKPYKMNYELLGNLHSHLHWHIIPRYKGDSMLKQPIWVRNAHERNNTTLSNVELENIKAKLRTQIPYLKDSSS
jgi:diadenosine tetraphosphate (Ap4A) HIT family hydrolase